MREITMLQSMFFAKLFNHGRFRVDDSHYMILKGISMDEYLADILALLIDSFQLLSHYVLTLGKLEDVLDPIYDL